MILFHPPKIIFSLDEKFGSQKPNFFLLEGKTGNQRGKKEIWGPKENTSFFFI
jgi:hypothetical protein